MTMMIQAMLDGTSIPSDYCATLEEGAVQLTALNESVFDVNIEKALSDYQGAYAVINNEFVKRELSSFEYVNREDDLGIDGLRRAKLSYHPYKILKKYIVKM